MLVLQSSAAGVHIHPITSDENIDQPSVQVLHNAAYVFRYALAAGVAVNLDNLQELERTAALIADQPDLLQPPANQEQQLVGLRINPQVCEVDCVLFKVFDGMYGRHACHSQVLLTVLQQ